MAKAKPNAKTSAKPKIGRPLTYTPEQLANKFEEYAVWVEQNPIIINKASAGQIVGVPTQRPKTVVGFCLFAKISRKTFLSYEKRDDFVNILSRVRESVESDQLEGALAGIYDSSIVARVLRLADRQDITTNGKEIQPSGPAISITIDEAAASIIQSIGKQKCIEIGNE